MDASRGSAALLLERLDALPTLPEIAARMIRAVDDPDLDASTISPMIESDPALAARILGLCRTAEKGLGDRIGTVHKAVVMLGIEAVRGLVLGVAVYDLVREAGEQADIDASADGVKGPIFDRDGHWRFALGTACLARTLATDHKQLRVNPDEAYLAGLLHDVGKPALDVCLPRSYRRVLDVAEARRSPSSSVERALIGMDHHEAGRRLAQRWKLPQSVIDVIWLHGQDPSAWEGRDGAALVSLVSASADICRALHLGWSGDFDQPAPIELTARRAGLSIPKVGRAVEALPGEVVERMRAIGMGEETSAKLLVRSVYQASQRLAKINAELERRARTSARRGELISELGRFCDLAMDIRSARELVACIGDSASRWLGVKIRGGIWQPEAQAAWTLVTLRDDPAGSRSLERSEAFELGMLARGVRAGTPACALLPSVGSLVTDLLSLPVVDHQQGSSAPAPGLVLLVDPDEHAGALDSAWATEESRALGAEWLRAATRLRTAMAWEAERAELGASARRVRESQPMLTEQASLARLGAVTAAAAHELNTPLAVIGGRAQFLLSSAPDPEKVEGVARSILGQVQKMDAIIAGLHELAEPLEIMAQRSDLGATLARASESASRRAQLAANVRTRCAIGAVETDHDCLALAIEELIVNAIESGCANVEVLAQDASADGRMLISVLDDGPGLSEQATRHAFDPLFSEKPAGRQRGLGLSRVRRLVEGLGGEVTLRGQEGGGTEAVIRLPRNMDGAMRAA